LSSVCVQSLLSKVLSTGSIIAVVSGLFILIDWLDSLVG
jgi:hypothetical protein